MARHLAKFVCFAIAGAAGWSVLLNLADLWGGWIPPAGGLAVLIVVYVLLYFLLARHLADIVVEKLTPIAQSKKHLRSGSGLSDLPAPCASDAPPVRCHICGEPGGPICPDCQKMMSNQ